MADNQKDFQNFIYPFSLGCLDKEDFVSMVEYIEAGGDFPWQELGELQNLTALLPSFLNIESPQASVKDRVARTLYKLKSEKVQDKKTVPAKVITKTGVYGGQAPQMPVRAQDRVPGSAPHIKQETDNQAQSPRRTPDQSRPSQSTQVKRRVNQTIPDREHYSTEQEELESQIPGELHLNLAPEAETQSTDTGMHLSIPDEPVAEVAPVVTDQPAATSPQDEFVIDMGGQQELQSVDLTLQSDGSVAGTETPAKVFEEQSASRQPDEEAQTDQPIIIQKRGGVSPVIFYLLILLIIAGVGYLYYTFNQRLEQLEKLQKESISVIRGEIANTASVDRDVMLLLSKKETKIYLLSGTPKYPGSFGKIIYSDEEQRGYIQLGSMPEIQGNEQKVYKAWVVIGGRNVPLNTPENEKLDYEFVRIFNMPDISQNPVTEFLVTKQAVDDSKNPSNDVILRGEYLMPGAKK
ncbi:MAG: hypothetical protein HUU54_01130 [Ignavibacteriaceae bacterium]|nr:hypothetical protein [Ignavibacteriaceae bacterium]